MPGILYTLRSNQPVLEKLEEGVLEALKWADQEALNSVDVGVNFADDDEFRGVPKVGSDLHCSALN